MLKKIMCIISTLIILISISMVPVFAEDTITTASTVNEWFVYDWDKYLTDIDFSSYVFPEQYNYDTSGIIFFHTGSKHIESYFYDNLPYNIYPYEYTDSSTNDFRYFRIEFPNGQWKTRMSATLTEKMPNFNNTVATTEVINHQDDLIIIVSDIEKYNYLSSLAGFKGKVYFNEKPVKSFVDYCNGVSLELNKVVAPEGFTKSGIKYSSSLDSPYGKYMLKPYYDEQENLVTAGLFSDLDIYYDSYFNRGSSYDHSETIEFYIDVSDVFVEDFGNTLFDYYNYEWDLPDMTDFFEKHFKVIHYEQDHFTALDFFKLSNSKIKSLNDVLSIEKVGDSYFIKFTLLSEYSVTYNVGVQPGTSNMSNSILTFTGSKITHTCKRLGSFIGDDDDKKGFGSDMSEADDSLSRPPTKDELKNFGFDYGYPNTQGSYPYKITIYRNGQEYFQMYFSKMPSVDSTYYTDKCIDYGINVNNIKIYMYFKEQHMSKVVDFTTNEDDMYYSDGHILNNPITDTTLNILNGLLNVDTSEFNNTYTLHFWTNYTGTFENMNGFYCKFNWDLQNSGHFQKNNSDDDYDYTTDYVPDESFTDNNGNIHGGAVEPPTETPEYNGFNNSDFSFDENSLWNYADSFLAFCAKAFKVLPAFIWQLIACSIVVVIILRVAGR